MKLIVNNDKIGGQIVKDNETYLLEDNRLLDNMVLSKTTLHVGKQTGGHKHEDIEELYFFLEGDGVILIDEDEYDITKGDIAIIPDGAFHRVYNKGTGDLVFLSIFQTYDRS